MDIWLPRTPQNTPVSLVRQFVGTSNLLQVIGCEIPACLGQEIIERRPSWRILSQGEGLVLFALGLVMRGHRYLCLCFCHAIFAIRLLLLREKTPRPTSTL